MNSFDEKFDDRLPLTQALMRAVGRLREFRGKIDSLLITSAYVLDSCASIRFDR